jgi:hypothetical protein
VVEAGAGSPGQIIRNWHLEGCIFGCVSALLRHSDQYELLQQVSASGNKWLRLEEGPQAKLSGAGIYKDAYWGVSLHC